MNIEEALEKLSSMFHAEDCFVDQMQSRFKGGNIFIKSALIVKNECFVAETFENAFEELTNHFGNEEVLFRKF